MSTRSDILLILTDQWNPRMLGYAGNGAVRTPNIDLLAAGGMVFSAAYTQCPVCMPARVSLASGLYPHNHGFWMNFTGAPPPAEQISFFRDVQRAGFTTAKIGKYHFFNVEFGQSHEDHRSYYDSLGLDCALEIPTPYMGPYVTGEYADHLKATSLMTAHIHDICQRFGQGDYAVVRSSPLPPDDHHDGYAARRSIEYIDRYDGEKPLFLCVSFPGPHTPLDAPGPYATMFDPEAMDLSPNVPDTARGYDRGHIQRAQANYFGKLAHLDDRVGELMQAMQRRGTLDDALVIFTADHGEYMGSHGRFAKGGFHEESSGIPLIVSWPGRIAAGSRCDSPVELIDIYPTVVEAAGGAQSPNHFGVSLLPVATGSVERGHDAVFSEIGRGKNLEYMVRGQRYKWFLQGQEEHLYDLQEDPFEMQNLIREPKLGPVLRESRARLTEFLMKTQVNHSAGYKNLFTRIGVTGSDSGESVAARLEEMFRRIQGV